MKKSILGLTENIAALVSYAGFFISGIAVLILEKENKFVRFHALQSTIWFLFLGIATGIVLPIFAWIPIIGLAAGIVGWFLNLLCFASWVFLMYNAYTGKEYKIPVIGDVIWAQVNK